MAVVSFLAAIARPEWKDELTALGGLVASLAAVFARAGGVCAAQELAHAASKGSEPSSPEQRER